MTILETERLIIRVFEEADVDSLSSINRDPLVMKYFPSLEEIEETRDAISRVREHQNKYGYSFYATELKSTQKLIGFVGIKNVTFDTHFTPAIEIGWRISSLHWNKGYATEAAISVVNLAFNTLGIKELVSFAVEANMASRRIMEKIGMTHNVKDDFNHPELDTESPLSRHVLYRLSKEEHMKQQRKLS